MKTDLNASPAPARESSDAKAQRARGQIVVARALWYVKPGVAELRTERLEAPRPGEARVAVTYSAISRGTERLVALGEVPQSEWQRMRAPLQAGSFPFPVKYGYSATGVVTAGPAAWIGTRVFALHPHQNFFQVPVSALVAIPEGVPDKRATLAANMETALNAHWDAGTAPGDRVLVVGGGIVGLLVAYLARRIAGTTVTLVDIDASRSAIAKQLGLAFATPDAAPQDNQIVFHTSATGAGLETAIAATAFEGRIIEMSWYGERAISLHLGGAFHANRITLVSSQVGHVAQSRRSTVSHRDRLSKALALLDDPALDALVSDEIPFDDLVSRIPRLLSGVDGGLAPVVSYAATL